VVDKKFQEATLRVPLGTDVIAFVKDPSGTPLDGQNTITEIVKAGGGSHIFNSGRHNYAANRHGNISDNHDDGSINRVQIKMPRAGTFSKLQTYARTNGQTTDSDLILQVNGIDSALSVTIPDTSTGEFEDNSNTVTVAAGDLISYRFDAKSGSGTCELTRADVLFQ
jgi:hypothetical protein